MPNDELSLEIGQAAWALTDGTPGSAGLSAPDPQTIRLLRVDDCEELVEFEADPGTAHAIVFRADGSASVEERTADQEAGAPLERRDRAECT